MRIQRLYGPMPIQESPHIMLPADGLPKEVFSVYSKCFDMKFRNQRHVPRCIEYQCNAQNLVEIETEHLKLKLSKEFDLEGKKVIVPDQDHP